MPIDPRFYESAGAGTLGDWAERAEARLVGGEAAAPVRGIGAAGSAVAGDVCFYEGEPAGAAEISPHALACFCEEPAGEHLPAGVAALIVTRPRLSHAACAAAAFRLRSFAPGAPAIDPEAAVHEAARLASGVVIGPGAAVGEGSEIGANSVIGPGVQIGRHCRIGHGTSIQCALVGDRVTIASGARLGEAGFGVIAGPSGAEDQPHFGRVIVQDEVTIGANTTVDRGAFDDTMIGERTKIDNLCQIAHNVVLGRGVIMAAFGGISGSVVVGDGVRLGGRVGLADHVTIGEGADLAASSGVFRDIPAGETWGGTPAKPLRMWMREIAWLQKQVRTKKPG